MKSILRRMLCLMLVCLILPIAGVAEAWSENEMNEELHVYVYVDNGKTLTNPNMRYRQKIASLLDTVDALSDMPIVWHMYTAGYQGISGRLDDVRDVITKLEANNNNESKRLDTLKNIMDIAEHSDETNRAILIFSSAHKDNVALSNELISVSIPVLFVQMAVNDKSIGELEELSFSRENFTFLHSVAERADWKEMLESFARMVQPQMTDGLNWQSIELSAQPQGVLYMPGYDRYRFVLLDEKRADGVLFTVNEDADPEEIAGEIIPAYGGKPYTVTYAVKGMLADYRVVLGDISTEWAKGETQTVSARIETDGGILTWKNVTAILTQADGTQVVGTLSAEGEEYVGSLTPNVSGGGLLTVRAVSNLGPVYESEKLSVNVINAIPQAISDETQDFNAYYHVGVLPVPEVRVALDNWFTDDAKESLHYMLSTPVQGLSVDEQTRELVIVPFEVREGTTVTEMISVLAIDAEGEIAEQPIRIRYTDVNDMLTKAELSVVVSAQDEPFAKGQQVAFTATVDCGNNALHNLLSIVKEHGAESAFCRCFKGEYHFDEQDGIGIGMPEIITAEDGQAILRWQVADAVLPTEKAGSKKLEFTAGWDSNAIYGYTMLSVVNNPPAVAMAEPFKLVIPDVLSVVLENDDTLYTSQVYDLSEIVQGEVEEKLKLTLSKPDKGYAILHDGDMYQLTESDQPSVEVEWFEGETPKLVVSLDKVSRNLHFTFDITDSDADRAEMVQWELYGEVTTVHSKLIAGIVLAFVLFVLILIVLIVVMHVLKPSMANRRISVEVAGYDGQEYSMPLSVWKKRSVTLWELVLYMGLPTTALVDCSPLGVVRFMAGRKGSMRIQCPQKSGWILSTDDHEDCRITVNDGETAELAFGEFKMTIEVE